MSSWVVRAACRQLRKWLDRGLHVPVAINCSGKELLHGDPARVLEAEAAAAGVPTSLIEIEITESLLVKDSSTVQSALQRLRQLGCRIALDDFGTGYSSLAYITRFPPDRIKIDKAFVRDVDRSPSDAAIANAILSLGAEPEPRRHRRRRRAPEPARVAARARLSRGAGLPAREAAVGGGSGAAVPVADGAKPNVEAFQAGKK